MPDVVEAPRVLFLAASSSRSFAICFFLPCGRTPLQAPSCGRREIVDSTASAWMHSIWARPPPCKSSTAHAAAACRSQGRPRRENKVPPAGAGGPGRPIEPPFARSRSSRRPSPTGRADPGRSRDRRRGRSRPRSGGTVGHRNRAQGSSMVAGRRRRGASDIPSLCPSRHPTQKIRTGVLRG